MSETSIASARASVMIYDDVNKKWVPSGSSSGLSKVHIFQHNYDNTFRVVGRKLQDHEVVINCIILKSLKYNQATETFHQWRDNKRVYGLNFSSKNDADAFARAMNYAVEILASSKPNISPASATHVTPPPSNVQAVGVGILGSNNNMMMNNAGHAVGIGMNGTQILQTNGHYDEDMGYRGGGGSAYYSSRICNAMYAADVAQQQPAAAIAAATTTYTAAEVTSPYARTMTKEDMAVMQERRMSSQQAQCNSALNSPSNVSISSAVSVSPQQQQQQYQQQQSVVCSPSSSIVGGAIGHQRTCSAPLVPQPPPGQMVIANNVTPPQPPTPSVPAPPCPPPLPSASASILPKAGDAEQSSLAAQLQSARLRRSNKQSAENSGSSTSSSGGSSSNYGTLGRGGHQSSGMASMMDEMAKTLARRRAAVEKKDSTDHLTQEDQPSSAMEKRSWNSKNSANGCESPKPSKKQLAVSSEELISKLDTGIGEGPVLPADLENLKRDIIRDVKKEMAKIKQDIIDAIKCELGKK